MALKSSYQFILFPLSPKEIYALENTWTFNLINPLIPWSFLQNLSNNTMIITSLVSIKLKLRCHLGCEVMLTLSKSSSNQVGILHL